MAKYRAGQTALFVVVDEVDPLVEPLRRKWNGSAKAGLPAHVTVLVPFLDVDRVDAAVLAELTALFAGRDGFDVAFERVGGFPGVRFLVPTPAEPFRALTRLVAARWPEAPPYGGAHGESTPHLTVADAQPPEVLAEVEAAASALLPVRARVSSVVLFVSDGRRWHRSAEFPLGGALNR